MSEQQEPSCSFEQFVERNLAWADALDLNKGLEFRNSMRDHSGLKRCCLAVAEDLHRSLDPAESRQLPAEEIPSMKTAHWFGWTCGDPLISGVRATFLNDDMTLGHDDIAKRIREWVATRQTMEAASLSTNC